MLYVYILAVAWQLVSLDIGYYTLVNTVKTYVTEGAKRRVKKHKDIENAHCTWHCILQCTIEFAHIFCAVLYGIHAG